MGFPSRDRGSRLEFLDWGGSGEAIVSWPEADPAHNGGAETNPHRVGRTSVFRPQDQVAKGLEELLRRQLTVAVALDFVFWTATTYFPERAMAFFGVSRAAQQRLTPDLCRAAARKALIAEAAERHAARGA